MVKFDPFQDARILVTVDLSKQGWDNLEPFELLSSTEVVLLGLFQITDQVTPEQARDQFEKKAQERINQLEERFIEAGVIVEKRLHFCVDLAEGIDRVARDEDCTAILTWNETISFNHIGVFYRAYEGRDNILNNVASVMADQDQNVTLVHFIEEDDEGDDYEQEQSILKSDRDYLVEEGLDEKQIDIRLDVVEDIDKALESAADQYDAIIMGETKPTAQSKIFGSRHEHVQENATGPVLIVRYPENDEV